MKKQAPVVSIRSPEGRVTSLVYGVGELAVSLTQQENIWTVSCVPQLPVSHSLSIMVRGQRIFDRFFIFKFSAGKLNIKNDRRVNKIFSISTKPPTTMFSGREMTENQHLPLPRNFYTTAIFC